MVPYEGRQGNRMQLQQPLPVQESQEPQQHEEQEGAAEERTSLSDLRASKRLTVAIIYAALLLDNVLLTVVVPILPDYLYYADKATRERLWNETAALGAVPAFPAAPAAPGGPAPVDGAAVATNCSHLLAGQFTRRSASARQLSQPSRSPRRSQSSNGLGISRISGAPPASQPSQTAEERQASKLPQALKVPLVSKLPQATEQAQASPAPVETALSENGRLGLLLSSKALVQLLCNPLVGHATGRVGPQLPQLLGSASLLVAALSFAIGERFAVLLMARSLQGVASACIAVSGMSAVAELFPAEEARSRVMGAVLGAAATGVLLGYPLGGLLYQLAGGKATPLLIVAALLALLTVFQLAVFSFRPLKTVGAVAGGWHHLLTDGSVLLTAGAILLSTSAMAVLEPCLPIWLMDTIKPEKWQLGTVFFPDSLGYLVGTNCFGLIAYRLGPWRVALGAMVLVGVSCILIPFARGMAQLVLPHLGLGLGIGVVDAALVPFLATLVDARYAALYGSVYSLEQTAVSLAYFLGPFIGGELVQAVGFPWLMRIVGILNLLYCPFLLGLIVREARQHKKDSIMSSSKWLMNYQSNIVSNANSMSYKRFSDFSDSE